MAKIIHSCGHQVSHNPDESKTAAQKKALAAESCSMCKGNARRSELAVNPLATYYLIDSAFGMPGMFHSKIYATDVNPMLELIEVRELRSGSEAPSGWVAFATHEEAVAALESHIASGSLTITQEMTTAEAVAQNRSMIEGRLAENKDRAMKSLTATYQTSRGGENDIDDWGQTYPESDWSIHGPN